MSKLGHLWWKGPTWLSNMALSTNRTESQVKSKAIKEMMTTTVKKSDIFDKLLEKHELYKLLKIPA